MRILVSPLKSDGASFTLLSAAHEDAAAWHTHMTGTLRKAEATLPPTLAKKEILARCQKTLSVTDFYSWLHELGWNTAAVFAAFGNCTLARMRRLSECDFLTV